MSQPPYYILFSHSAGAQPATLGHPNIHYHYANDDPSVLWPQHPNEHVLVLDYPQSDKGTPTVQSLSKDLVVVSLKVEEAPAAAATGDNELRNNNMYIIETTTSDGRVEGPTERKPAYDVVAQFKRR
ncbi:hypothetical protein H0H93_008124 [Arthromyces matolae]|nr:hypothetical protein H0H93_008124 [Arthromyces matolae]